MAVFLLGLPARFSRFESLMREDRLAAEYLPGELAGLVFKNGADFQKVRWYLTGLPPHPA
jgi:hypothetical protein